MIKQYFRLLMALLFSITCSKAAYAEEVGLLSDIKPPQQSAEYIYRSSPKESLISVQLLGAIDKPGIYYVPASTDLLKLLTIAGGTTNSGDLSGVLVRKLEPKSWSDIKSKAINEYQGAYEVDVEKVIKFGGGKHLHLHQDDFVYVPPKTSLFNTETSRGITMVSVLFTITLTALLINKNTK
ncbi:MAG: SLBB domain-containing protein [Pseudobdellovibrionaceae bacterium]